MTTSRIRRLLALIQALHSGRSVTVDELAREQKVSRRTIFRDLDVLSLAGIKFLYDRGNRTYTAADSSLLPPVSLTHAEALVLLMAARFLLGHNMVSGMAAVASAGLKLQGLLPRSVQEQLGDILDSVAVRFDPASDANSSAQIMPVVQASLIRHLKLQMRYDSYYEGRVIEVVVHPYKLAYIHRGWYLIGYCERDRAVRTFKIERILSARLLERRFRSAERFSLDDYLGNAWMMIRGDKTYHVRIRFLKKVAASVDEIVWHRTQRTAYEDDGSLVFEVDVDGVDEIAWWVLGYGDQAQVLEPPELRERVAGHARRMVKYYGPDGRRGTVVKGMESCEPRYSG